MEGKEGDRMDKGMGFLTIAGSRVAVLFVVLVKHKAEVIMNFCIRAVLGQIAIYGINSLLSSYEIPVRAGMNFVSLLTSGILGFSGISLLYAILALRLL